MVQHKQFLFKKKTSKNIITVNKNLNVSVFFSFFLPFLKHELNNNNNTECYYYFRNYSDDLRNSVVNIKVNEVGIKHIIFFLFFLLLFLFVFCFIPVFDDFFTHQTEKENIKMKNVYNIIT